MRGRLLILAVMMWLGPAAGEALASFTRSDANGAFRTAIRQELGSSVARQMTTRECTSGRRSHTCAWRSPDSAAPRYSGSIKAAARRVRGRCKVLVTGRYVRGSNWNNPTYFRRSLRGRARYCR